MEESMKVLAVLTSPCGGLCGGDKGSAFSLETGAETEPHSGHERGHGYVGCVDGG